MCQKFWLQLVLALLGHQFSTFETTVWLRITDEGSVPEMRIWSILLIKSDLKWCIPFLLESMHLSYEVVCCPITAGVASFDGGCGWLRLPKSLGVGVHIIIRYM